MADKARFYLEQSIPELQELEKKKIFTKVIFQFPHHSIGSKPPPLINTPPQEEISAMTKKRSDFEHRVNATGSTPADFARYATYEMNLESLRRKRVARLGIKAPSHAGQRRIFFVLDRATRRFHGNLGLWMQYIEYARKERASKVLAKVFSSVLKLHPAKPELWIFAARHAVEVNADMVEARSHMQRGLRFNKGSRHLWLEYAKLEMVFIAKVLTRRQVLGIDGPIPDVEGRVGSEDEDGNIKLPTITGEDMDTAPPRKDHSVDSLALENVDTNPALNGAIALAIFDSAVKEFPGDLSLVNSFFELFRSFDSLNCRGKMLEHVVHHALDTAPTSPDALFLGVELPIVGVETTDPLFPSRLGTVLLNMSEAAGRAVPRAALYERFAGYMLKLVKTATELDPGVRTVILGTLIKNFRHAEAEGQVTAKLYLLWSETMVSREKTGRAFDVAEKGLQAFPGDEALRKVQERLKVEL